MTYKMYYVAKCLKIKITQLFEQTPILNISLKHRPELECLNSSENILNMCTKKNSNNKLAYN